VTTEGDNQDEINRYVSSGIEERHGSVPGWLVAVIVTLVLWMVYYLVHYWQPS
jgi:hypothetical protein